MGPTWVQSAPDGHHVGPMNLAIEMYDNDNDNENEIMCTVKVEQKSKTNNQQCKYMIHHQEYHQMVKYSRVCHNLDKGGGSDDLCAPRS